MNFLGLLQDSRRVDFFNACKALYCKLNTERNIEAVQKYVPCINAVFQAAKKIGLTSQVEEGSFFKEFLVTNNGLGHAIITFDPLDKPMMCYSISNPQRDIWKSFNIRAHTVGPKPALGAFISDFKIGFPHIISVGKDVLFGADGDVLYIHLHCDRTNDETIWSCKAVSRKEFSRLNNRYFPNIDFD